MVDANEGTPDHIKNIFTELPEKYETEKEIFIGDGLSAEAWVLVTFPSESSIAKTITRHPEADVLVLETADHGHHVTSIGYFSNEIKNPKPYVDMGV